MNLSQITNSLPNHLKGFVTQQNYQQYTAQDHALWRYVMGQNVKRLSKVAHETYVNGLKQTGISLEEIPELSKMNEILQKIGWAAIAVDGFIPPSAFMEFQARKILVIAADIRPIDQIGYTPAPDIIHEAAGHAPIIADKDYAEYLRLFGQIGAKAFSSALDFEIYEAVRNLSIIKTDPYANPNKVKVAENKIESLSCSLTELSEMARIRNMHWWTVEYGLIGDFENPKIYGAGLLSSIQESFNCLTKKVSKIPYSIAAAEVSFDITTEQPQLFITPNFQYLTQVLNEFADTMALRKGGLYAVNQAIKSKGISTVVYSSGLAISGIFADVETKKDQPIYLRTKESTALSVNEIQLPNHGKANHPEGFGSPVGKLLNIEKPLELHTDLELRKLGIDINKTAILNFESGVKVVGKVTNLIRNKEKLCLLSFRYCTVSLGNKILFSPEWGSYDMAVGATIISAFQGAADPDAFGIKVHEVKDKTKKIVHSTSVRKLHLLYAKVKQVRLGKRNSDEIPAIWHEIKQNYLYEWLLPIEILELAKKYNLKNIQKEIGERLYLLSKSEKYSDLVYQGIMANAK